MIPANLKKRKNTRLYVVLSHQGAKGGLEGGGADEVF